MPVSSLRIVYEVNGTLASKKMAFGGMHRTVTINNGNDIPDDAYT